MMRYTPHKYFPKIKVCKALSLIAMNDFVD